MAAKTVSDIMTSPVVTISGDKSLVDAIKLLLRHHISGLPVVDGEENIVGIITELDVLNFAMSGSAAQTKVSEVMTSELSTFQPDAPIEQAMNFFAAERIRRVPVVREGKVVGIVSRRDVMREILSMYTA